MTNTIKLGSTTTELRSMLEEGTATNDMVIAYIDGRIKAKAAKGQFIMAPMRKLYEELTGKHVKGRVETEGKAKPKAKTEPKAEPVKAAKPAKPAKAVSDMSEYTEKVRNMKDGALAFSLARVKDEAKKAILQAEHDRRNGAQESAEPESEAVPSNMAAFLSANGFNYNALSDDAKKLVDALGAFIK